MISEDFEEQITWIYVWTVSRLLAVANAQGPTVDRLSGLLTEKLMIAIREGKYDPERGMSLLTWLLWKGRDICVKELGGKDAKGPDAVRTVSLDMVNESMYDILPDNDDPLSETGEFNKELAKVTEAVALIKNERARQMVHLIYVKGYTRHQVAEIYGMTYAAARKMVHRAVADARKNYIEGYKL